MLGWVFVLKSSLSSRITLCFLKIQGDVLGVMLSCILVKEILDSSRVGSISRPKGFIDFSFFVA